MLPFSVPSPSVPRARANDMCSEIGATIYISIHRYIYENHIHINPVMLRERYVKGMHLLSLHVYSDLEERTMS